MEDEKITSSRANRHEHDNKKKSKKKHKHTVRNSILIAILVIILAVVAFGAKTVIGLRGTAAEMYHPVQRETKGKAVKFNKGESFTMLFLMTEKTKNQTIVDNAVLFTPNAKTKQTATVAVNQEMYLPQEKTEVKYMMKDGNAGHALDAMQRLFGVSVDKYVQFDVSQLGQLVTAAGGVIVTNNKDFISQGYEFKPGTIALNNATEVQAYVHPASSPKEKSTAYSTRQQAVLMALLPKLKSARTLMKLGKLQAVAKTAVKSDFKVGQWESLVIHYNTTFLHMNKLTIHTKNKHIDGKERKVAADGVIKNAHNKILESLK